MKYLSIAEIEYITYQLAQNIMEWGEPIPDFGTRFPNILESCLAVPFQKFNGKYLYPGLIAKAAVLFYLLIKNHPFQNGNKRIAVVTLLYFLYKHKKWLKADNKELYNFAKWVAESNPSFKKEVVSAIKRFIKSHLVNL